MGTPDKATTIGPADPPRRRKGSWGLLDGRAEEEEGVVGLVDGRAFQMQILPGLSVFAGLHCGGFIHVIRG